MRTAAWFGAVAVAAGALLAVWPLTHALPPADARGGRLAAFAISALICLGMALARNALPGRSRVWIAAAVFAGIAGAAALVTQYNAAGACIAEYDGKPRIVGRTLQPWVRPEPGATPSSILFDAAGSAESAWTAESIRNCRWTLGWVGLGAIPLFATSACALLQAGRRRLIAPAPARQTVVRPDGTCRFDAFLSYRHVEPDRSYALELMNRLEESGLRCAIDQRDFAANQHFLSEMERCIKESRFVLCVVTSSYVDSDHCVEEAVLSKTLDMSERTRRVVPLIFERVELPVWLHGIVGVDFTEAASVDPVERVRALIAEGSRAARGA